MCIEAVFFWPVFLGLFWAMFSVHEMSVRAQKRPRIGDNERESAEIVTEITDKHGDRKIRVHSGPVLGVRAQKWSQKSPTNMETEKSVYILGVQKFLVLSTFLVGTSNTLP